MTEIAFHFNAPDKVAYACRLLRKAVASGAKLVVTGESQLLRRLDQELWTFAPLEFLPHSLAAGDTRTVVASPVLLSEQLEELPHSQVLVNLGEQVPRGFERFERLIEVVSLDEADRQQARGRWKHYVERGYAIVRHDLNLKA